MKYKILIYCMLVMGIGLVFYSPIKNSLLTFKNQTITREYVSTIKKPNKVDLALSEPSMSNIIKMDRQSNYMGVIKIESIELQQFVSAEFSDQSLFSGVVNLFPERQPEHNNIVLLGHHVDNKSLFFGRLTEVDTGDSINLMLGENNYQYKISKKHITTEENIKIMDTKANESKLTLITCDKPTYTRNRLVIEAQLERNSPEKTSVLDQKVIEGVQKQAVWNYLPLMVLLFIYSLLYIVIFKGRGK